MIFKKIEMNIYEIDLKDELINAKHSYKKRSGFILRLFLDDYIGCGEAAPLDFFSQESLKQVAWKFEELKASLRVGLNYYKDELLDLFYLITKDIPSLNFAADIALLDVASQSKRTSLSKYLNSNALPQISLSDFYFAGRKVNSKVVKVKLGQTNLNEDIQYLERIIQTSNARTVFRVDLNQSYTLDEVVCLSKHFINNKIQYIEEPIKNPTVSKIKKLKELTHFSIALDETIINKKYDNLISSGLIDYAILKVPLFGSINNIFNFKKFLDQHNTKLILSSSLQSPVGNISSIHIAAALELKEFHGLNFFNFYCCKNSLPYNIDDNIVNLKNLIGLGVKDEIN